MNYCGIDIDYSRDQLFDSLGLKRLKESYMLETENSPQERFAFVSSKFGSNKEHAQRLYEYSSKHWLSYSTPILSFGRNKNGLPISCFLPYLHDSSIGLVECLSEVNWLSMLGGGVGIGIGIRSADDKSTGVLPHLKTYDASSLAYRQGRTRRGSYAAYLDISHPDILMFIELRKPTGDPNLRAPNLHHGINITDDFMQIIEKCMEDPNYDDSWHLKDPHSNEIKETVSAKDLWRRILETRMMTGEPYIHFIDTSNNKMPDFQKRLNLSIKQSNLCCVTGDTKVLTDQGYQEIEKLDGLDVNVWNGKQFTDSTVVYTGDSDRIYKIETTNGNSLLCTHNHKFYIQNSYNKNDISCIFAEDLKPGMKLEKWSLPTIDSKSEFIDLYSQGFYSGDGNTNLCHSWIYWPKFCCINRLSGRISNGDDKVKRTWHHGPMKEKCWVPCASYSLLSRLSWLSGLLDADGTVTSCDKSHSIQISSVDNKFLIDLSLMLDEIGVSSKINLVRKSGKYDLPDGNGGLKKYDCQAVYRLVIAGKQVEKLLTLGLNCERLKFTNSGGNRDATHFIKVKSVSIIDGIHKTYCLKEKLRGRVMFNGIITGNSEIILPTSKDRTAVCCLSSLNIEYYDDWKNNELFISDVAEMLDNVLTYFIENAPEPIHRAKFSAARERSIGIGALGFHSYLQKKMIPFEGLSAKILNKEIFKHIRTKLNDANERLGNERGSCPDYNDGCENKYINRRFAHVMAIAPNASSSIIMGNTSPSIEPMRANAYRQDTISGAFLNKNKFLDKIISEKFKDSQEIWSSIIANDGSIQHLDLDDKTKEVFKTAIEIDQRWVIEHAADRQEFIDQAQSLNLFFLPNVQIKYLHQCHFMAWKRGLKTLYYCRSEKIAKSDRISEQIERKLLGNTDCLMCEG
jgi:ribonucleotide reductase alpha subunit